MALRKPKKSIYKIGGKYYIVTGKHTENDEMWCKGCAFCSEDEMSCEIRVALGLKHDRRTASCICQDLMGGKGTELYGFIFKELKEGI